MESYDVASSEMKETDPDAREIGISGFWHRIVALAIDVAILMAFGFLIGQLFFDILAQLGPWGRLIGFTIALPYFTLLNSSVGNGQTVGKRLLCIKVQDRNGAAISPTRSLVRYLIVAVPFFLSGIPIPTAVSISPLGFLVAIAVFGTGGLIIYLYVFNRRTRQSLHDLILNTYVVQTKVQGKITAEPLWKGHMLVSGIWVLLVILLTTFLTTTMSRQGVFTKLLRIQESIQALNSVQTVNITIQNKEGKTDIRYFKVHAFLKKRPADFQNAANEIVSAVLKEYPDISKKYILEVNVSYGYDLGIARKYDNYIKQFS